MPLCLLCREDGHEISSCTRPDPAFPHHRWLYHPHRAKFLNAVISTASKICQRCADLDILSMFEGDPPLMDNLDNAKIPLAKIAGTKHHRNLGAIGSLRFESNCSLCVCLFAITPSPSEMTNEVHLIANWAIHRLEGHVAMNSDPRNTYSVHVFASQLPKGAQVLDLADQHGDALGIVPQSHPTRPLYAQAKALTTLDISWIQRNLDRCQQLHFLTCATFDNSKLSDILLIDVDERTLVAYPEDGCDFLTLSYVWGATSPTMVPVGGAIPEMPRTIEDAITLTRLLGKRYLWADCVCIDQVNEDVKIRQIRSMFSIYQCAYANIVGLSTTSMDSGLARVPGSTRPPQPQLACGISGRQIVGLGPTLSDQIFQVTHGSRAWTLQEIWIARRNIYISDEQVYFECNAMHCCEHLNEDDSWIHHRPQKRGGGLSLRIVGAGVLRWSAQPEGKNHDGYQVVYGVMMSLYSRRKLTHQTDALYAFSGIMQSLQDTKIYPDGFFFALPVADLHLALHWTQAYQLPPRADFPTWSWLSREGHVWPGQSCDTVHWPPETHDHFIAWKFQGEELVKIHPVQSPSRTRAPDRPLFMIDTPFDKVATSKVQYKFNPSNLIENEKEQALVIECGVCDLAEHISFSDPPGDEKWMWVDLNGVKCFLRAAPCRRIWERQNESFKRTKAGMVTCFALTSREKDTKGNMIHHRFLELEVDPTTGKARRVDSVLLLVPLDRPEALHEVIVERRQLVLF